MAPPERPAFPSTVEPDDEDEEEEVSTLPEDEVERRAEEEIEAIESEVDPDARKYRAQPSGLPVAEGEGVGFIDRAWARQHKVEARFKRIGHGRYSRVIRMARKPEPEEFRRAAQITAIGIFVIGLVGFLIFLLTNWIWGALGVR